MPLQSKMLEAKNVIGMILKNQIIISYNRFFNIYLQIMRFTYLLKTQLILLILFQQILSLDNFQRRCVYYSNSDSACTFKTDYHHRDNINLYFYLSDQPQVRKKVSWGWTTCDQTQTNPSRSIIASTSWTYQNKAQSGYKVRFLQQGNKTYNRFGRLESYILNVTLESNICKIQYLDYNCTIIGDGTIMHFGNDFSQYPPSELHLKCQRIWKLSEE